MIRRLLVPSLITLVLVAILVTLGTWQLHRLAWKQALLAEIAHAEQSPPVPLVGQPSRFARVIVTGTLRAAPSALYADEVRDIGPAPVIGAQLLQILDRPGAPPILVDLGWVPTDPRLRTEPKGGPATIIGFARPAEHPGWLSAPDDPQDHRFYTLDPAAIGQALGAADLAPFTLVAMGPAVGNGPIPADAMPAPPNNHLSYAFTWFGLAAALAVVYGTWVRKSFGGAAGTEGK